MSVNCLDRHVRAGRGDRVAFYFEGEPGDREVISYADLLRDVCKFANGLRSLGIKKGDRVAIYMPMIPELPVAMLACTRIGAAHTVIFGGFSPDAIVDRVTDAGCVALITADAGWRRGKHVALKDNCDAAMVRTPNIEHCVVVKHIGNEVPMHEGRDVWWHDLVADQPETCEPTPVNAEDLLFILYTSGTTAKPKGIKHTTGGYLTGVATTHELVFDIKESDIYWCTADIGWVTGHSYIVYGPLANGATGVLYEGTPDFPDKDRFWEIVERYKVTIMYTAPTAIRTFMKWGTEYPRRHDLSSLRLLGSVGLNRLIPRRGCAVSQRDRRRALPGRGHVVANRDRHDHDYAVAGHHDDATRKCDARVPGRISGRCRRRRKDRAARRWRLHRHP